MTWLQDFFAIINGIFSPPNWGNPCLRERTSRRSGWILFVSVKKNDPEKGVILLMATRNPARKPVDVAHMIYVNIPLFKGFLHPRWLAGFLPSTVSQKVGPWDYHFVSFGVWGGWIWVRIFWDSSVSSSKGNIAVSDLVKYFSIYPDSGKTRCIFKVSTWIVFLNLHSGRKLGIISFTKLVKHIEMKITIIYTWDLPETGVRKHDSDPIIKLPKHLCWSHLIVESAESCQP